MGKVIVRPILTSTAAFRLSNRRLGLVGGSLLRHQALAVSYALVPEVGRP